MNNIVIVDTPIWIEYLRGNSSFEKTIEDGLIRGRIYVTGPIVAELLQGVKNEKELQMLSKHIDAIPYLECGEEAWRKAGLLSFSLMKVGKTLPLTDILIAAVAMQHEASIFTLDGHFERIPEISLYKE